MTKAEQNRLVNFRYKFIQHAEHTGNVALTCRYFGISRVKFYKWKKRFDKHGTAGLCDQPKTPHKSPNETPKAVVSKILYLRRPITSAPARFATTSSGFTASASLARPCSAF